MDFAEGTTDSTCKDPCLKSQERIKFEIMVNFGYHTTNHMYAIKSYFPSINFLDYTLT